MCLPYALFFLLYFILINITPGPTKKSGATLEPLYQGQSQDWNFISHTTVINRQNLIFFISFSFIFMLVSVKPMISFSLNLRFNFQAQSVHQNDNMKTHITKEHKQDTKY